MVFVSGGYTRAKFGAVNFNDENGVPTDISLASQTYSGWFIGSGYEYAIAWFPGLTWKTEYRFADYGKENVRFLEGGVLLEEFARVPTNTSIPSAAHWSGGLTSAVRSSRDTERHPKSKMQSPGRQPGVFVC